MSPELRRQLLTIAAAAGLIALVGGGTAVAAGQITTKDIKNNTIKSEDFNKGQSFTYTATKPGTFAYICTIHPQMKATLIVTG